jgi:pimeloyl-ACP methyl ester carboxylesterase
MDVEEFRVELSDATLADLRRRLTSARLVPDFGGPGWAYGTPASYLGQLVDYWLDGYDWRKQEHAINQWKHYRVQVGHQRVHFIHERGRGPAPVPIILTHGWPWTFWDYHQVIGPLTDPVAFGGSAEDAFDVVVPSLPGFGFSLPLADAGITPWTVADLWATLMTEGLGYERFAAAGGDWGAVTTAQLGHKYAEKMIGIYLTHVATIDVYGNDRPWDPFAEVVALLRDDDRRAFIEWERRFASHIAVHVLSSESVGAAMNDSPVGLCAWLVEKRQAWSDCGGDVERRFSKDDLITNVMLYWATGAFPTSARYYSEAALHPWRPSHDRLPVVEAPTGYTIFLPDAPPLPRDWIPSYYNVCFRRERSSGGHFAPAEEPLAVIEDIRATFRSLR